MATTRTVTITIAVAAMFSFSNDNIFWMMVMVMLRCDESVLWDVRTLVEYEHGLEVGIGEQDFLVLEHQGGRVDGCTCLSSL